MINTLQQEAIKKMIERVFEFCPNGICPFCDEDVMQGETITEETPIVTKCPKCHRSFVD